MTRPRALLLSLHHNNAEMEELLSSLGFDLVVTVVQNRNRPDPMYYMGSGKIEEVREQLTTLRIDRVILNAELKPSQMFTLQQAFAPKAGEHRDREVEVFDRIRVILEIFSERAKSQEARLQVELAKLRYEMPLIKEAIHLAKKGERAGPIFGSGEYDVNHYFDMMKRRMTKIRDDLDRITKEREVRRKHRRKGGFHLVSLAGYTNAGKSSLLRVMADDDALAENRYFSTLSTRTRRAKSTKREILVTDTVGFIEDLPPWLIEAFHSTLEEIALADVILLVVDGSDPLSEMRRRLRASQKVLWDFQRPKGFGHGPRGMRDEADSEALASLICVINKTDLVPQEELTMKVDALLSEGTLPRNHVLLSARTGEGVTDLFDRIYASIPAYDQYEVTLPQGPDTELFLSIAHERTDVLELTKRDTVHVLLEARVSRRKELEDALAAVAGAVWRRTAAQALAKATDSGPEQDVDGKAGASE